MPHSAREFKHLQKIERERAKQRERLSKGRGKKGTETLPDLKTGDARDLAAAQLGISGRTANTHGEGRGPGPRGGGSGERHPMRSMWVSLTA